MDPEYQTREAACRIASISQIDPDYMDKLVDALKRFREKLSGKEDQIMISVDLYKRIDSTMAENARLRGVETRLMTSDKVRGDRAWRECEYIKESLGDNGEVTKESWKIMCGIMYEQELLANLRRENTRLRSELEEATDPEHIPMFDAHEESEGMER